MTKLGGAALRVGACLSLTGKFARFGIQAGHGLEAWRLLDGKAEVLVEDDESDPKRLESRLRSMSSRCDLILGPYSTQLMRAASRVALEGDELLWNHGGSGDDVQAAHPGHVVSVLAPTSRYAVPFLHQMRHRLQEGPLWLVEGRGSFGRQVIGGAEATARAVGLTTVRIGADDPLPPDERASWSLFCAGSFEEDIARVDEALAVREPPLVLGAVAAGVHEFGAAVGTPDGVYGVAQWVAGSREPGSLGPPEDEFLTAYAQLTTAHPDYPAVQAASAAVLAVECARRAGSTSRADLWASAVDLRATTMLGAFKIDPATGAQLAQQAVLVRWEGDELRAVKSSSTD